MPREKSAAFIASGRLRHNWPPAGQRGRQNRFGMVDCGVSNGRELQEAARPGDVWFDRVVIRRNLDRSYPGQT